MPRGCGSCNLCCKLLNVPDIGKPAQMLCWWTGLHGGCSRQSEKGTDPSLLACAQFECMWLNSQKREDPGEVWPRHWRPDISHMVVGPQDRDDPTLVHVHVDPAHPGAWKESEVAGFFRRNMTEKGVRYEIHLGEFRFPLEAVD